MSLGGPPPLIGADCRRPPPAVTPPPPQRRRCRNCRCRRAARRFQVSPACPPAPATPPPPAQPPAPSDFTGAAAGDRPPSPQPPQPPRCGARTTRHRRRHNSRRPHRPAAPPATPARVLALGVQAEMRVGGGPYTVPVSISGANRLDDAHRVDHLQPSDASRAQRAGRLLHAARRDQRQALRSRWIRRPAGSTSPSRGPAIRSAQRARVSSRRFSSMRSRLALPRSAPAASARPPVAGWRR